MCLGRKIGHGSLELIAPSHVISGGTGNRFRKRETDIDFVSERLIVQVVSLEVQLDPRSWGSVHMSRSVGEYMWASSICHSVASTLMI